MTRRPLRNVAASVRTKLLNRARAKGEDFQFLLQRYAAERFLHRLGGSDYRSRLYGNNTKRRWLLWTLLARRKVSIWVCWRRIGRPRGRHGTWAAGSVTRGCMRTVVPSYATFHGRIPATIVRFSWCHYSWNQHTRFETSFAPRSTDCRTACYRIVRRERDRPH